MTLPEEGKWKSITLLSIKRDMPGWSVESLRGKVDMSFGYKERMDTSLSEI